MVLQPSDGLKYILKGIDTKESLQQEEGDIMFEIYP